MKKVSRLKKVAQGDLKSILMSAQFIGCKDAGQKVDYTFKLNLDGYQPQEGLRIIDELEEVVSDNLSEIAAAWVNLCKDKVLAFLKDPSTKHYEDMLISAYFYEKNVKVKGVSEIPEEFISGYLQDLTGYINSDFKSAIEDGLEDFDYDGSNTITITTH